ncbi:glycosyltransferase [Myxococcota bacterium]|nr:glycosyltransferase [Myxococcota bacterium]
MDSDALPVLAAYLLVVGLLGLYGLHRLLIVGLYRRHRDRPPAPLSPGALPVVTVQLPVYNEPAVVERLVDAACALDWPAERLEIQVLDDSDDGSTARAEVAAARGRARGVDVRVLRRPERVGYKAGALAYGLAGARGELLAVFDADFVPRPDFLRRTVPYFDGFGPGAAGVGMVQARWGHLNEGQNLLTRLAAVLLDGHFVVEHTARHRSGRFFNFNGTAGIWRRACVEDAGGWQHDTLTEDLDLSYRAQLRGWRFVFLRDEVVPAELPADLRAYKLQQHRWAKGTMQTARKLLPVLLAARLPAAVRLEALAHLGSNLAYPLVLVMALLMPPAIAARGHGELLPALVLDLPVFLLSTASIAWFYGLAERDAWPEGWRARLWRIPLAMALGIGMAVNQSRAVFEGLFGRDRTFRRTPKRGDGGVRGAGAARAERPPLDGTTVIELGLAAYYALAAALAVERGLWASLPFLLLFGLGFAFVGLGSLAPAAALRRAGAGG